MRKTIIFLGLISFLIPLSTTADVLVPTGQKVRMYGITNCNQLGTDTNGNIYCVVAGADEFFLLQNGIDNLLLANGTDKLLIN